MENLNRDLPDLSSSYCSNPDISVYSDVALFISLLHRKPRYNLALYNSFTDFNCNKSDLSLNLVPELDVSKLFCVETIEIFRTWDMLTTIDPFDYFTAVVAKRLHSGFCVTGHSDGYFFSQMPEKVYTHKCVPFCFVDRANSSFVALQSDRYGNLKHFEISFNEFSASLNGIAKIIGIPFFASFIRNKDAPFSLDLPAIVSGLNKLIDSGFDQARKSLETKEYHILCRNCRLINEHAGLMLERLEYLSHLFPSLGHTVACFAQAADKAKRVIECFDEIALKTEVLSLIEYEELILREAYRILTGEGGKCLRK